MDSIRSFYSPTMMSFLSSCSSERVWSSIIPASPEPATQVSESDSDSEVSDDELDPQAILGKAERHPINVAFGAALHLGYDFTSFRAATPLSFFKGKILPWATAAYCGGVLATIHTGKGFNVLLNGLHLALIAANYTADKNQAAAITRVAIWTYGQLSHTLPARVQKVAGLIFQTAGLLYVAKRGLDLFDNKQYYSLLFFPVMLAVGYSGLVEKGAKKLMLWGLEQQKKAQAEAEKAEIALAKEKVKQETENALSSKAQSS